MKKYSFTACIFLDNALTILKMHVQRVQKLVPVRIIKITYFVLPRAMYTWLSYEQQVLV